MNTNRATEFTIEVLGIGEKGEPKPTIVLEYAELDIQVKYKTFVEVTNRHLTEPVTKATFTKEVEKVSRLVLDKKIPEVFLSTELPVKGYKYLSWRMVCLVWVAMQLKDERKKLYYGRNVAVTQITLNDCYQHLDERRLFGLFYDEWVEKDREGNRIYRGKHFSFFFKLEGLTCHNASFYRWSQQYPGLPNYDYGKGYSEEEFDQWRQFLRNKPGRRFPKQ
jgi:hypothetical protein